MLSAIVSSLFDHLADYSSRPWFLLLIFGIALFDSVIPIVPSETTVIIGGVAAGAGQQNLVAVILVAWCGALIGDNLAYQLGVSASTFLKRTLFRGTKGAKRLVWAENQLQERGGMLLITGRFIPGGRTAITVASGITRQPRRRFFAFVALAAAIWATYASLLGYLGGKTFADDHTKAFLLAFAAAISVSVAMEAIRWFRHRKVA